MLGPAAVGHEPKFNEVEIIPFEGPVLAELLPFERRLLCPLTRPVADYEVPRLINLRLIALQDGSNIRVQDVGM